MSTSVAIAASQGENITQAVPGWSFRLIGRIERYPGRAFLCLTLLYTVAVCALSSFKLLWLDELITLHIARLSSIGAIWQALSRGVDPNPPLTHIAVHFSRLLFGEREFALRLPAFIGYWIGLASLFAYLRRFVPVLWAICGTMISMAMAAFDYSYESRSYGIFYGLAMLSVFCWSSTVDPYCPAARRRWYLFGMFLALAAGISTNYFAVLAFLPIAGGELTRTLIKVNAREDRGRDGFALGFLNAIDVRIWLALLFAATPLLIYRPLIERSIALFAPYAWNKNSMQQVIDSYTEMVEIILYPILALLALALIARGFAALCDTCQARLRPRWFGTVATQIHHSKKTVPPHEAAAILLLMAYPLLGYVLASIRGGMLSPRFVIPVCLGFSIAATLTAYRLFGYLQRASLVLLFVMTAWFVARESVMGYWYVEQKQCFYKILSHLPEAELAVSPGAPIAIPDPLLALTFQHYAPASVANREVFPIDFPALRFYRRDDSPEENLWAGRSLIYTLPVMPLAEFQAQADSYLLIADDDNWLVQDLRHHGYTAERLPINTRAGAIGGFTPIGHGVPSFFVSAGDARSANGPSGSSEPVPFRVEDNLPAARLTPDQITAPGKSR